MPDTFYRRNPHVDPELLGLGLFSAIASAVVGIGKTVFGGVQARRKERRQAKQDIALTTMNNQTALEQSAIAAKAKETSIIIPAAIIGGVALLAVLLLKK